MSKRRLSSAGLSLPAAKRQRSSTLSFESLYDELILAVFSTVAWQDICRTQATSKFWSRLTTDNQLWKTLYMREFPRSRFRMRSNLGDDATHWKSLFRISSNWRTGRIESIERQIVLPADSSSNNHAPLVLIVGPLIITASTTRSPQPTISLRNVGPEHILLCGSSRPNTPIEITALALDQSPSSGNHTNLAVFLSSGEFVLYTVDLLAPTQTRKRFTYVPSAQGARTSPIIQSTYHHPLLITLSREFHLSIYDLSHDTVTHTQTLTSFSSMPPTSLILSSSSPGTYKLVLTYAVPVYPRHYGIGVTELIISDSTPDYPSIKSPMCAISTRSVRALDVPSGWIDEAKLSSMRAQWSRKVPGVAATQTDGKWVVLCPDDRGSAPSEESAVVSSPTTSSHSGGSNSHLNSPTSLQLYRLSLPNINTYSSTPKLTFVRSLCGLTGPVAALALAHGRCVGLGVNGSIWVWDLEAATCAEVAGAVYTSADVLNDSVLLPNAQPPAAIAFDDRRIISSGVDGVVVRRFDI